MHRTKKKSPIRLAMRSRLNGGGDPSGFPAYGLAPAQVCAKTVTKISRAYIIASSCAAEPRGTAVNRK